MTYTELTAAIADLLDRTDLTTQIPTFIEQCESGFTAPPEQGGIRDRRDVARLTVSVAAGERYVTLPDGYVELVRLKNNSTGERMTLATVDGMQDDRDWANDTSGDPVEYRHGADDTLEIRPTPASTVTLEIECFRRVTRLNKQDYGEASAVTQNWVSQWYPDVYVYGAAVHAAPFLHDDARIATWAGLYSIAVNRLNGEAKRARSSTSSPRLRNRGMSQSRVPY